MARVFSYDINDGVAQCNHIVGSLVGSADSDIRFISLPITRGPRIPS